MSYFTKDEALQRAQRSYRERSTISEGLESYNKRILKTESASFSESKNYDIFLSHSYQDANIVHGIKTLIEDQGFTVYVDWIEDQQLNRAKVTKETAATLRKRMNSCRSFLYLATKNSSDSKWMPWELGYFDGKKNSKIAILPVLDRASGSFEGQEYLSIYPEIKKYDELYVSGHALFKKFREWV
jgi:hypothetical protein